MEPEPLNYRRATTAPPRNEVDLTVPLVVMAAAGAVMLVISLVWMGATWSRPGRAMLVPTGDVAQGLLSHAGSLYGIEHAGWMGAQADTVRWELPWAAVLAFEMLPIVALAAYWRRRPAARLR
jgi:hypothetical protein